MIEITDEMVKAYRLGEHAVCVEGGSINAAMRAGLEAVVPGILREERWKIMRGVWSDDHEESDDEEDHRVVGRALCAAWGHEPTADQCGRPEHDFCLCCGERTPHQATRGPSDG